MNTRKGFSFGHSFKTDGVSLRLRFVKKIQIKSPDIDEKKYNNSKPKRGLYAIDTIKKYSKLNLSNMQIIGIDPGMYDLIHAVGEDYLIDSSQRLRYSAAQRRTDKCSSLYAKKMRTEKPPTITNLEQQLSAFNSRSSYIETLNAYFISRRTHLQTYYDFYGQFKYRARRWRTFKKDQQSISNLIMILKECERKVKHYFSRTVRGQKVVQS